MLNLKANKDDRLEFINAGLFLVIAGFVGWFGCFLLYDSWLPRDGFPWPALIALLFLLPLVLLEQRRWKTFAWLSLAVLMAYFAFAPHPRKDFLSKFYSVKANMHLDQVLSRVGGYKTEMYVGPGIRVSDPSTFKNGYMMVRWNTHDAAYDADVGQIDFLNGRVVKTEFMAD